MKRQVEKYARYKSAIKFMLVASGVWPNFDGHPRALRQLLSIVSIFASGFTFYCIVAFCIKYATNLKIFTGCLGLMIGFFSTFIKICILASYQEDLQSLNDGISARFEDDLRVPENRPHLLANFPTFSRFFHLYSSATGISICLLVITPLMMASHGKYVRMYPQLMPFTYEPGGATHWSVYGFEVFCGFYLWSVTSGVDSVFGLYSLHMVGELRLLGARFQNLHSSENYKNDLKDCINRHWLLMESRHKLQRVFGFLAIWLAVTCGIALCALVFQATLLQNTSIVRKFYLFGHWFLKLVQAYSYAWSGNVIAVESELCQNQIYNAQWAGCGDTRFMNDVLVVLSQKPLIFRAKGCMLLQLDMFTKSICETFLACGKQKVWRAFLQDFINCMLRAALLKNPSGILPGSTFISAGFGWISRRMQIVHTSVSYFFLLQTLEEKPNALT